MTSRGILWLVTSFTQALAAKRVADGNQPDKVAARALDVETSTYQRWRTGKAVPADEHAPALADYLGVSVQDVYAMLGEARNDRKAAMPPPSLAERVDKLEELIADLTDAVQRMLGDPPPAAQPSPTRRGGRPRGRSEQQGQAS